MSRNLKHKNLGITQEQRDEMEKVRIQEGGRFYREVLFHSPPGYAQFLQDHLDSVNPDLREYIQQFVVYDIWQRPILDTKTRALLCIAGHTCLGAARQIGSLTKCALSNGATKEEVMETLMMMLPECGFPLTWNAMLVAGQSIKDFETGNANGFELNM